MNFRKDPNLQTNAIRLTIFLHDMKTAEILAKAPQELLHNEVLSDAAAQPNTDQHTLQQSHTGH